MTINWRKTAGDSDSYAMHISVFGDLWKLVERDGKAVAK